MLDIDVEAVVLTGGASRRMGQDKANLTVNGEIMSERLVRLLSGTTARVTLLGPGGVPDPSPGCGPLAALAAYRPQAEWVFVVSCDIPRFDPALVAVMRKVADAVDAVLPELENKVQPLCGLYRATCFASAAVLVELGSKRVMSWVDSLNVLRLGADALAAAGLRPDSVMGANTPEEWKALVRE